MKIRLEFLVKQKRTDKTSFIFLKELRRDLVLLSDNDNCLICLFYSGSDYYEELIDITGCTLEFIVKESSKEDTNVLYYKIDEFSDSKNGEAKIIIDKEDCKNLVGNYIYEIRITTPKNKVHTLCYGTITFLKTLFK